MASVVLCAVPAGVLVGTAEQAAAYPGQLETVSSLAFGEVTLGDYSAPDVFTIVNVGDLTDTITALTTTGPAGDDYLAAPVTGECPVDQSGDITLLPFPYSAPSAAECTVDVFFLPGALGERDATLNIVDTNGSGNTISLSGTGGIGYYQVNAAGKVAHYGDAAYYGDASNTPLNQPIVGMAQTGDNGGYWLVAKDGGIFPYGDAQFYGSTGGIALNKPIVGMAPTIDGNGYWLVASDGGIFSYGDAQFYGSTGGTRLNKPIVGMAVTPDGNGYWLVASDGGIFSYGDAQFYGSTGGITLNKPIVGMAPTPDGGGYWLVASDGGIFAYGDALFHGSTGSIHLAQPIVGMAAMPTGNGYWFTAADGGLFNYGDAPYSGSAAGQGFGTVVGMATDGAPTLQGFLDEPALRHGALRSWDPHGAPLPLGRLFAGP